MWQPIIESIIPLARFFVELAVLVAVVLVVSGSFAWVLEPLRCAAMNRRLVKQFSLADLFCLFVLVQLPFGVIHWMRGKESLLPEPVSDSLAAILVAVVWWAGVAMSSSAGIQIVWHRCVILLVVLPGTLAGTFAVIILPFLAVFVQIRHHNTTGYWLLLAEPLLGGALYGLGRFMRYIVASAQVPRTEMPSVPEK
jgi:hypothetical protein